MEAELAERRHRARIIIVRANNRVTPRGTAAGIIFSRGVAEGVAMPPEAIFTPKMKKLALLVAGLIPAAVGFAATDSILLRAKEFDHAKGIALFATAISDKVRITADRVISRPGQMTFEGNVVINTDGKVLKTDRCTIETDAKTQVLKLDEKGIQVQPAASSLDTATIPPTQPFSAPAKDATRDLPPGRFR